MGTMLMSIFEEGQLRLPHCSIHDSHPSECFEQHHPGMELDNGEQIDKLREEYDARRITEQFNRETEATRLSLRSNNPPDIQRRPTGD